MAPRCAELHSFAAKIPQAVQATVKFLALLARAEWFKAKARPSVQAML